MFTGYSLSRGMTDKETDIRMEIWRLVLGATAYRGFDEDGRMPRRRRRRRRR